MVCGAWHVPALTAPLPAASRTTPRWLKGLPKTAVATTWVPWTHGRLASLDRLRRRRRLAGLVRPPVHRRPTGWSRGGWSGWPRCCADEDLPVSTAHVIEAVRLAEALAALRGRPLAGLAEVNEATRAVLCDGDEVRLALVTTSARRRRAAGRGPARTRRPCRWPATSPRARRRLRLPPEALVPRPRPRPAQAERSGPQPPAAPAAAARRRRGGTPAESAARQGHVPGVVAAGLGSPSSRST